LHRDKRIRINKDKGKKKEYAKRVTKKRKRKSINMTVKEEIVKIERSAIDRERSIQTKEGLILRKTAMKGAEARTTIRKIRTVNTRRRRSVEIALRIEKRIIAAHEKERKEAIIDLFIIDSLFLLLRA
jgi:hypothetical protein